MTKQRSRRSGKMAALAAIQPLESRVMFSAAATPSAEQLVAQANNAFAFDLLHQIAPDTSGNTFFSPYSAATALEMALQGAKGVTASQMVQALHLPDSELAQAGIEALNQLFQATSNADGYTLSTANRLWVNQNLQLLDSFVADSQNIFGAGPQSVDFSNPTIAANTINNWVSQQTNGKITNLIPPSDLNAFTALVITNAIYFQANWVNAFNPDLTQSTPFQISSTEAATVQMMQQTTELGYYAQSGTNGFQALDLPYQGNNLDMIVILPTTYDLGSFQSTFTPALFSQITSNLITADVDVQLPKFELNESYNLNAVLQNLGIQAAFSGQADFSGIANEPLCISEVVQKSYVQVNETGTTAAAATGVITVPTIAFPTPTGIPFDADHPFMFAIRDRSTNTILFLGSVADPSAGTTDYTTPATTLSDPVTGTSPTQITTITSPALSETAGQKFTATLATVDLPTIPTNARVGVTIHWGNGTISSGTMTPDGTAFDITGKHRYHASKQFHVEIDVWQTLRGKRTKLDRVEAMIDVIRPIVVEPE